MADLLYEWNMTGSPSCSVLRLHNAQQAVVNLARSYPSQLKRYQALTWWMEDKSWEGYPFRQSWMTLTEPCVKAHFVFARTISICRELHLPMISVASPVCSLLSLFPSTSHPVGKRKEKRNTKETKCYYDLKIQVQKCMLSLSSATTKTKCTHFSHCVEADEITPIGGT